MGRTRGAEASVLHPRLAKRGLIEGADRPPASYVARRPSALYRAAPLKQVKWVELVDVCVCLPRLSKCGPVEAALGSTSRRLPSSIERGSVEARKTCSAIRAGTFPIRT